MTENFLRLQPGRVLDQLHQALDPQVDTVLGIPKQEWSALEEAADGLSATLLWGGKFLGESIRWVARVAVDELSASGNASTRALEGHEGSCVNNVMEAFASNFS